MPAFVCRVFMSPPRPVFRINTLHGPDIIRLVPGPVPAEHPKESCGQRLPAKMYSLTKNTGGCCFDWGGGQTPHPADAASGNFGLLCRQFCQLGAFRDVGLLYEVSNQPNFPHSSSFIPASVASQKFVCFLSKKNRPQARQLIFVAFYSLGRLFYLFIYLFTIFF